MTDDLESMAEFERDTAAQVIRLLSEGKTAGEVLQKTGVPARKQREIKEAWHTMLSDPRYAEGRSKQLTGEIDEQYTSLIRGFYDVIDEAEMCEPPDIKTKATALKEIANIHKMRAEIFMKAGLINKDSIGDDIAEAEAKIKSVEKMLLELSKEFPQIKPRLREMLLELDGKIVPRKVVGE